MATKEEALDKALAFKLGLDADYGECGELEENKAFCAYTVWYDDEFGHITCRDFYWDE